MEQSLSRIPGSTYDTQCYPRIRQHTVHGGKRSVDSLS